MKEDLVSIVVPVYNCEKFIRQTINTVKKQTYNNWELLLVNDCSTDRSKEIIIKMLMIYGMKRKLKNKLDL